MPDPIPCDPRKGPCPPTNHNSLHDEEVKEQEQDSESQEEEEND